MTAERLIKKYANRRLYDASQSRHITLDDIRSMVIAGERVKVVEDKTNEDITRLILLQVIADPFNTVARIVDSFLRQFPAGIFEHVSRKKRRDVHAPAGSRAIAARTHDDERAPVGDVGAHSPQP